MNAAQKRWLSYCEHEKFLSNVTGLTFGPPFLNVFSNGVTWVATVPGSRDWHGREIVLRSVVTKHKDLLK